MNHRTIIIGGGAIGLSLAWELARRDVQVTLIDRGEIGKATSWAAAGILPPANFESATDAIDQLRGLSHRMFPDWTDHLKQTTGIDTGFRRCGGWYLANTPGERASMVGMTEYWREMNIRCEQIASQDVVTREPHLADWFRRSPNASAWWTEDECQIRSPDYLKALTAACQKENVQLVPHTSVFDIDESDSRVKVSATNSLTEETKHLETDSVVVCAGARTGLVAPMLRLQRALVPIRGQILLLKSDIPLFKGVVNVGHRYLVARDDGHTLVGSCEEEVGLQLGTTAEMLASLKEFALDLCPELSGADEVQAWSGLRPMTFDGFPIIGRVPESANVYVASGHYRSGLHLSPATAVAMADLMLGKKPAVSLDAFRVGKQQSLGK